MHPAPIQHGKGPETGRDLAPDPARNRVVDDDGGLSLESLRIVVDGAARDCRTLGHQWAFLHAPPAPGATASLVCQACGQDASPGAPPA